jgi:hypothetical protein
MPLLLLIGCSLLVSFAVAEGIEQAQCQLKSGAKPRRRGRHVNLRCEPEDSGVNRG